jgi:hypothetical protein
LPRLACLDGLWDIVWPDLQPFSHTTLPTYTYIQIFTSASPFREILTAYIWHSFSFTVIYAVCLYMCHAMHCNFVRRQTDYKINYTKLDRAVHYARNVVLFRRFAQKH